MYIFIQIITDNDKLVTKLPKGVLVQQTTIFKFISWISFFQTGNFLGYTFHTNIWTWWKKCVYVESCKDPPFLNHFFCVLSQKLLKNYRSRKRAPDSVLVLPGKTSPKYLNYNIWIIFELLLNKAHCNCFWWF